jgi:hypothetical protein
MNNQTNQQANSSRQPLNAKAISARLHGPQIVRRLMTQPAFSTFTESKLKANGHLRRDSGPTVHYFGQGFPRHLESGSGSRDGQIQRYQPHIAQDDTGVGRVVHQHGLVPSVVVQVVNDEGIARVELENHSPIGLHGHRPVIGHATFELVKPQVRCSHIANNASLIEHSQHQLQPPGVHGLNTGLATRGEKQFKPFVRERFDHADTVTPRVTNEKALTTKNILKRWQSAGIISLGFSSPPKSGATATRRENDSSFFYVPSCAGSTAPVMAGRAGASQDAPVPDSGLLTPHGLPPSFSSEDGRFTTCQSGAAMTTPTTGKSAQTTPTTASSCAPLRNTVTTPYQRTIASYRKVQREINPATHTPDLGSADTYHQLAFNALSTASWYLAQGKTDKALGRILSAARQLKQAVSEQAGA